MADFKDRIRVHIEGKEFSVVGGSFQAMLAAVKQINGRRFVSALKVWQLPGKAEEIKNQLAISGFQLEGGQAVSEAAPASSSAAAPTGNDRIRVMVNGQALAVVGGGFREMLDVVKTLPGRRFNGDSKLWEIPGDVGIIKNLIETAGFQLEGAGSIPSAAPAQSPAKAAPPQRSVVPPPAYEPPDFSDDVDVPPYEPPDWWDDDNMPPPPVEPPDWFDEEAPPEPPDFPEPPNFSSAPSPRSASGSATSGGGDDQIRIRIGGIPMVVAGGSFQAMLAVVKNIPGRRFHSGDKVWDIPDDSTIDSVQQVVNAAGFVLKRG